MYQVICNGIVIATVEAPQKHAIILEGKLYPIYAIKSKEKTIHVFQGETFAEAKKYEGEQEPFHLTVTNTDEDKHLPSFVRLEGDYVSPHKVIELKGELYHVDFTGTVAGVHRANLIPLRIQQATPFVKKVPLISFSETHASVHEVLKKMDKRGNIYEGTFDV